MLDFSEISTDGTQFELLLREILFSLDYHVIWSGVGADGGRDLLGVHPRFNRFSVVAFLLGLSNASISRHLEEASAFET